MKERASLADCGIQKAELHSQSCSEKEDIRDCLSDIRCNGVMGVPITFLDKYNPDQFEIVGASMDWENTPCHILKNYVELGYQFYRADGSESSSGALRDKMSPKIPVKGKSDYSISPSGEFLSAVYGRIFIKRKENS